MKRVFADGWFQMFAAICGLSALIMAFDRRSPPPVSPEPSAAVYSMPAPAAAPAAAPPALPASAPAASPRSPLPSAAPAAENSRAEAASRPSPENLVRSDSIDGPKGLAGASPAAAGPAASAGGSQDYPIFKIAPKTPGRWIVSKADGPDVDSPSIMRVIFSASDGDVILIRPGMYLEPLAVVRKSLTFRGLGKRPEEVLITSPNPAAVLSVDHAKVTLENLRIEPERGFAAIAAAVYVASGRLTLRGVVARSRGAAIQAAQGTGDDTVVDASSSRLDGAYADLLVRGEARVALKDVEFSNPRQPVVVWRDTALRIVSCRFPRDSKARIYAYEDSPVAIAGSPTAPPVSRERADADASADKAKFAPGGSAYPQAGRTIRARATSWVKDIFRPGRKPGDLD